MRFIDFFAGIGGFRLGLEMAGHECVGHCEIDKYADKSYRAKKNKEIGTKLDKVCYNVGNLLSLGYRRGG